MKLDKEPKYSFQYRRKIETNYKGHTKVLLTLIGQQGGFQTSLTPLTSEHLLKLWLKSSRAYYHLWMSKHCV